MRKDFEGEARGFGVVAECAIGGATLRRVNACADRGEEARCKGSGEDDPERDDIWRICRVAVGWLHFWWGVDVFVLRWWDVYAGACRRVVIFMCRDDAGIAVQALQLQLLYNSHAHLYISNM